MSGTMMFNRFAEFPRNHEVITPSDSVDLPREMLVYAGSNGNVAVRDYVGRNITYTVTAGSVLPIMATRILATGTTATPLVGLY